MQTTLIFFINIITLLFSATFILSSDSYIDYKKNIEEKYRDFNNREFWLKQGGDIDKILITRSEISRINKDIRDIPFSTVDLFTNNFNKKHIKDNIVTNFRLLIKKRRYLHSDGTPITRETVKKVLRNLHITNIDNFLQNKLFAVTLKHGYLRGVPVSGKIVKSKTNTFDRNIETVTHTNEPVRILNISKDGEWYYVASSYSFGWIEKSSLAIINDLEYFHTFNKNFIILTQNYNELKLGDTLPYIKNIVYYPSVDGANNLKYMELSKLPTNVYSIGFLDLTRRNIINLIFNIAGTQYAWGGAEKEWDCSLFIMDLFRCFGINLPRNSQKQSEILFNYKIPRLSFNRENLISKNSIPFLSFLYSKGHIMLYLGTIDGKVYIAHDFIFEDFNRGQLMVTDLDFKNQDYKKKICKLIKLIKVLEKS